MKRLFKMMMCLLVMMTISVSAKAQEVTITLMPGWTWICYPYPESVSLDEAFGSFTPMAGDIIRSQNASSSYIGTTWRGNLSVLLPGVGYKYYSNRSEAVTIVFGQTTSQLTVTTTSPTDITALSATSGGDVTSNDGSYVFVKGVCWATHQDPLADNDFHSENGNGAGSFSVSMTDLIPNTLYYVRAYAVSTSGIYYGDQQTFTTRDGIPTLTTADVTYISGRYANCGGTVTDDGGLEITARGVCWSTSANPTLNDSHTIDGTGLGSFNSTLTALAASTTYYVRAYATTEVGTGYGEEMSFTTLEGGSNAPEGAIDGLFSVSATKQVYFSQGNLQYIGSASTPYWKFAENQWDYYGSIDQGSTSQNVDRDLFGWGTSGYNHGANCYQPWSTSEINNDYHVYGQYFYNLYDQTGQADWGYNPISNGGDQENQWSTLRRAEWVYVFNTRSTASGIRYAKAKVNNVNGVILLPDDWSASTYALNDTNTSNASFSSNEITAAEWSVMEQAGAIFLPAAGGRYGVAIRHVGIYGYYWSASFINSDRTCVASFGDSSLGSEYANNRYDGFSIRLVRVAQ